MFTSLISKCVYSKITYLLNNFFFEAVNYLKKIMTTTTSFKFYYLYKFGKKNYKMCIIMRYNVKKIKKKI